MPEAIISVKNLSKHFGKIKAVDDLNLEVFQGDVFGFLGPNGAGKSTTIRMMLSLVRPTGGEIFLFGKNLKQHRKELLSKIGCIIEKPDFYLYLSAAKNIEIFSRLSGGPTSKNKILEVLESVGLKGRENDKVQTYSHGMKQRLGIAQTLIHDPELIILDEPTNGLDPQGIIDVRELILHLQRDRKKTIFLSSHILSEVEQIASRMAIIDKGRTVVQGSVNELLSTQNLIVTVETENSAAAKQLFAQSKWSKQLKSENGNELQFQLSKNEIPVLAKFLAENSVVVYNMSYRKKLEDYFLNITHH